MARAQNFTHIEIPISETALSRQFKKKAKKLWLYTFNVFSVTIVFGLLKIKYIIEKQLGEHLKHTITFNTAVSRSTYIIRTRVFSNSCYPYHFMFQAIMLIAMDFVDDVMDSLTNASVEVIV